MIKFLSLISGSSGNASFISDGTTNILIDCGMSGSRLKSALGSIDILPEDLDAVLITHEHSDHIKGLGVIARRYNIPIYATEDTFLNFKNVGEIDDNLKNAINGDFEIGDIGIHSFSIPHDAANPVGYNFFIENKKLSLATDIGKMTDNVFESIKGSKQIILESNHDTEMLRMGPYPYHLKKRISGTTGHLSNDEAASAAIKLAENGTDHFMLAHLSLENNLPEIAKMTCQNAFSKHNMTVGKDVTVTVAARHSLTEFGALI